MEIQGTDGSTTRFKLDSTTIFGRHNLSHTEDLSVSRNHLSFDLISSPNQTSPRISFEVIGKNPIWVFSKNGDKKVKTFKRFQRSDLGIADLFCVSGKNPVWFTLKMVNDDVLGKKEGKFNVELTETLEGYFGVDNFDFGFDSVDVSCIDPVQEFGFLVIGHEFDKYPRKMIRDIKNWDWFLDDPIRGSDDEEEESRERKEKKGGRRKRKEASGDDEDEEEWTAESEGEELTTTATKLRRPKYHTRSKNPSISHTKRSRKEEEEEEEEEEYADEDEDEEDQTLGGFIVDDETVEGGEGNEVEDDDEEEFVEDEDDEVEE